MKSLDGDETPLEKTESEAMYNKIVAKLKAEGVWEDDEDETEQGSQG